MIILIFVTLNLNLHTVLIMSSKQNWLDFLISHNAIIQDNKVIGFNSDSANGYTDPKNNFICDLSHFGIVSVAGEDSQNFLQNQFCNDVRNINTEQNQINAYCTPKGRVLALFRLLQHDNKYLLHLPDSSVETTIKRLQMFVLMSKVTIKDERDALVSVGIVGRSISDYVSKNVMTLPNEIDKSTQNEKFTAIHIPGIQVRYVLFGQINDMQQLWSKLTVQFKPASSTIWSHMDIESGLPQVYFSTADAFVPQMLNLHSINGLSFKKGCYPGQEVVARMHYLGKLKRRMYLGHIMTDTLPQPGVNLLAVESSNDQSIGKIVNSAPNTEGGVDFLAVMQISAVEAGNIILDDSNKTPVIFKDLPYPVEISRDES